MGNFTKLIDELKSEISERNDQRNFSKSITNFSKRQIDYNVSLKALSLSARKLNRSLTPSKAEQKKANQITMDNFKRTLKTAILAKSITSIEAIKLENIAHHKSTELAKFGLI